MMRLPRPVCALSLVFACGGGEDVRGTATAASASQASISISISGSSGIGSSTGEVTEGGPDSTGGTGGLGATTSGPALETGDESGDGPKFDVGDESGGLDTTTGADAMCPCAAKLDLIYVLSDDRELWTYDPANNIFTMIGPLGCPTSDGTFSMGVGRDGKAWVQTTYVDDVFAQTYIGDLFVLDVDDPANCSDPGYSPGANGWQHFGMGFAGPPMPALADDLAVLHHDRADTRVGRGGVQTLRIVSEATAS